MFSWHQKLILILSLGLALGLGVTKLSTLQQGNSKANSLAGILAVSDSTAKTPSRTFKEPEVQPPFVNLPPLLNTGSALQTKLGGLTLGAALKPEDIALLILNGRVGIGTDKPKYSLDAADKINGLELCIGGDCRNSWPTFQKGVLEVRQCPIVDSGTACGGNTCVGQLTNENSCLAVGGVQEWECPLDCNLLPSLRNQCIQNNRCTKKLLCRQESRDCPIVGKFTK